MRTNETVIDKIENNSEAVAQLECVNCTLLVNWDFFLFLTLEFMSVSDSSTNSLLHRSTPPRPFIMRQEFSIHHPLILPLQLVVLSRGAIYDAICHVSAFHLLSLLLTWRLRRLIRPIMTMEHYRSVVQCGEARKCSMGRSKRQPLQSAQDGTPRIKSDISLKLERQYWEWHLILELTLFFQ